uniref:Uncharacterized protein n=1 Tax=Cricetulus griseus TaxID=10029 RepID=A0A8C2MHN9_CRIGR
VGACRRCCSHAGPPGPPQPSTGKAAALQRHRVPGDRCPRPRAMSAPRRPGGGPTASPPPRRPCDPDCPQDGRDLSESLRNPRRGKFVDIRTWRGASC